MSPVGERKSTLLATKFLTILGDPQETFFYQINCFRVERVSVNFSSLLHASKKNFAIFYTFFKQRFISFNIPKKTGNKYCMATQRAQLRCISSKNVGEVGRSGCRLRLTRILKAQQKYFSRYRAQCLRKLVMNIQKKTPHNFTGVMS